MSYLDGAIQAQRAQRAVGEGRDRAKDAPTDNEKNERNELKPAGGLVRSREAREAEEGGAADATRRARRAGVPSEMPDPGAKCRVHRRFLTFAEQLHGRCSWCEWQERQYSSR